MAFLKVAVLSLVIFLASGQKLSKRVAELESKLSALEEAMEGMKGAISEQERYLVAHTICKCYNDIINVNVNVNQFANSQLLLIL